MTEFPENEEDSSESTAAAITPPDICVHAKIELQSTLFLRKEAPVMENGAESITGSENSCEMTPPRTLAKGGSICEDNMNPTWFRVKLPPSNVALSVSCRKSAAPCRDCCGKRIVLKIALSEKSQLRRETTWAILKDAAAPDAARKFEEILFLEKVQSERETLATDATERAAP